MPTDRGRLTAFPTIHRGVSGYAYRVVFSRYYRAPSGERVPANFNGLAPQLSVGQPGQSERFMAASENDPTFIAQYEVYPAAELAAGEPIYLYITPGSGSTMSSIALTPTTAATLSHPAPATTNLSRFVMVRRQPQTTSSWCVGTVSLTSNHKSNKKASKPNCIKSI
ncbi:hypothetical protein Mesil_1933 [Allomeiothermus silvanus DSM 9946]|uniref:Uncharacterized protein n=1 Tax=Allomeiothermus silvanus (strain ATCC 700542 / DSM 9946 / NBRC 106475 / NCIMB 13440 / VI-R2) TaxID=526227 RepID=D7BGJ2_ALLS1|nr:hypothetical protein Mesil_1933 [Allomeiothermus silvanus DSM 9946]